MALVKGRDEQGQWHIEPWPGPSNVSFKKLPVSGCPSLLITTEVQIKCKSLPLQQAAAFDGCSQGTGKKQERNTEIWQVTLSNTNVQAHADRMFFLHTFPPLQSRPSAGHWWSLHLYGWLMQQFSAQLQTAAVSKACAHTLQQCCSEPQVFHFKNKACGFHLRLFRNSILIFNRFDKSKESSENIKLLPFALRPVKLMHNLIPKPNSQSINALI